MYVRTHCSTAEKTWQKVRRTKHIPISDWVHVYVCVSVYVYAILTHEESLSACLADRREGRMRQGKVKNWFSVLCLSLGTWALTAQDICIVSSPLHPTVSLCQGSSSGRHAGACSLCPVEPAWRSARSLFPVQSRPVTLVREPENRVKVPHQDSLEVVLLSEGCTNWAFRHRGNPRERTMDSYRISVPAISWHPPPNSHSPSSVSLSISHFVLASLTALPQSHSFSSFFIHLCILLFFPPSLLPPSAQCNYSNGFFPPRLMASDILSRNEANHALKGHV